MNLAEKLNSFLSENNIGLNFKFKEDELFEDLSIKCMKSIYWIIKRKFDNEELLRLLISSHISLYLEKKGKNKLIELNKSGEKFLKYEITPEMLEYKGYNKTKFKNIEGLYGLMKMN